MIEGSIKKDVVLNGSDTLAVFKEKGLIYRSEPIPIVQEISIYNLEKDITKVVKLNDRLAKDYQIIGVTADIPEDDDDAAKKQTDPGYQPAVQLGVRVYSSQKAIENISLLLTAYPLYTNKLLINHRDTWHLKASRAVNRITYRCVPIYLEDPIIFP